MALRSLDARRPDLVLAVLRTGSKSRLGRVRWLHTLETNPTSSHTHCLSPVQSTFRGRSLVERLRHGLVDDDGWHRLARMS